MAVIGQLGGADVLDHADRADRVERAIQDVAVVLDAEGDPVAQPGPAGGCSGVRHLRFGQGDPDHVNAVPRRGVQGHPAPPAAQVRAPLDVQITRYIRAGDAQLPRAGHQPANRICGPHPQHGAGPDRPQHRAVVGLEADRHVAAEEPTKQHGHRHRADSTDARAGAQLAR